ncbi:flagellar basal body P-ring formation chaperone FlgA [Chelativorans sp. AA-79]|uniref:flagellar basal body P-ring formation chaperone FlgA n=1 Tax=Chelativorans sp. AA-79 TaxID=3028735 RepID=UPI0023F80F3E|nr:flagellar basal body P-ring formation chaperone FlgA [Chelativorans sp. AA-79]WEX08308.1 flagellar basal body P-ring formation chaperone FlgA [Chelativorans sp. AA-79]
MASLPTRRILMAGLVAALPWLAVPASAQEIVVVPVRVIYPGETIAAEALQEMMLRRPPRGNPAIARSPADVEGKVARRTLLPGRLLPLSSVRDAYLVEQGSTVTAVFADGPLTISILAVPLQAGAAGDLIKMRNIDSGAVFTGTVMRDGTVRVGAS